MKYLNITTEHELSFALCGELRAEKFVHMERTIAQHVLIIMEDGVLNIETEGERHKAGRGEMLLLPAGIHHRGFYDADSEKPIKYFWAHFSAGTHFTYSHERASELCLPFRYNLAGYDRVKILCSQLLGAEPITHTRKKYCDFIFTALCCEISEQFKSAGITQDRAVTRAMEVIEAGVRKKLSLEIVSREISYSKQYLSRRFKECTGITVNDFIAEKKLALAKQMLASTNEPVSAVAASLGFEDAGYFMRLFKKRTGMTCLQYRNTL